MRLIDGDALVEALMTYMWHDENGRLIDDADEKREYIKGWLPNLPTVDLPDALRVAGWKEEGWVSVKDRLPEVGKVVLAFGTRSATTGMFQGTMTNRPNVWMWKNHTLKKVTHWMPLPKPPKKDNDATD